MLQFAGLAAILNEINPGLAEKLNVSISHKVQSHLTEPITKSYKYGWTNGFITGLLGGIVLTTVVYRIRQGRKIDQSKSSS